MIKHAKSSCGKVGNRRIHGGDEVHQFEPWLRAISPNRRAGQGGSTSGRVVAASIKASDQPNLAVNCPNTESSKTEGLEERVSCIGGENSKLSLPMRGNFEDPSLLMEGISENGHRRISIAMHIYNDSQDHRTTHDTTRARQNPGTIMSEKEKLVTAHNEAFDEVIFKKETISGKNVPRYVSHWDTLTGKLLWELHNNQADLQLDLVGIDCNPQSLHPHVAMTGGIPHVAQHEPFFLEALKKQCYK